MARPPARPPAHRCGAAFRSRAATGEEAEGEGLTVGPIEAAPTQPGGPRAPPVAEEVALSVVPAVPAGPYHETPAG